MSLICAVIFITDSDSEYFTIKFYHGGKVEKNNYPTGAKNYFHKCDAANMSLIELRKMANKLSYIEPFNFYYKNNSIFALLERYKTFGSFLHLPNLV